MKKNIAVLPLFFSFAAFAQVQPSGCFEIFRGQLRDYNIKTSDVVFLNSIHDQICQSTSAMSTESMTVGVRAIIDAMPVGANFGSGSTTERAATFCRNYQKDTAVAHSAVSFVSQVSGTATKGVEACLLAESKGLKVGMKASPEAIAITIRPRPGIPVKLMYGNASKNLKCTTSNSASTGVKSGVVPVKTLGVIGISCARTPAKTSNIDDVRIYEPSELLINVDDLDSPLQFNLPASEQVGRIDRGVYELKLQRLRTELAPWISPLSTRLLSGLKCVAAFDRLPAGRYLGLMNTTGYLVHFDRASGLVQAHGANTGGAGTVGSSRPGNPATRSLPMYGANVQFSEDGKLSIAGMPVGNLFCPPAR